MKGLWDSTGTVHVESRLANIYDEHGTLLSSESWELRVEKEYFRIKGYVLWLGLFSVQCLAVAK
jgi:hypothetical protein